LIRDDKRFGSRETLQCVSIKSSPFLFFVITFRTVNQFKQYRAKTELIKFERLMCSNLDTYSLCVATLHRKMTLIYLSIP